jgi:hypothetical protein
MKQAKIAFAIRGNYWSKFDVGVGSADGLLAVEKAVAIPLPPQPATTNTNAATGLINDTVSSNSGLNS